MARSLCVGIALVFLLTSCQLFRGRRNQDAPPPDLGEAYSNEGGEAPVVPDVGLPMSTEQRFSDVPVPAGVKEDLERSYVYESATLQIGRMVYTIRATVNQLTQFYIDECAALDWKLESVLQADGAELSFVRPGKRLRVTIRSLGVARGGSLLVVHMTPEGSVTRNP